MSHDKVRVMDIILNKESLTGALENHVQEILMKSVRTPDEIKISTLILHRPIANVIIASLTYFI